MFVFIIIIIIINSIIIIVISIVIIIIIIGIWMRVFSQSIYDWFLSHVQIEPIEF